MHLSVEGEVDGKGIHVLELAAAQARTGKIEPVLVTCPSPDYDDRFRRYEISVVRLADGPFAALLRQSSSFDPGRLRVDLVHGHGHHAAYLLAFLRCLRRPGWTDVPFVFTCHGFHECTLRRRVRTTIQLRSYRYTDAIIICCRDQEQRIRQYHSDKLCVYIPNGAPSIHLGQQATLADQASSGKAADTSPIVAAVGRLCREKRHDIFLRACAAIHRQRPDVRFLLVGEGPERRRLEALASSLGLSGRVEFTGLVDDIWRTLNNVTVLMHTSDSEGTPLAVLEAMAVGIPVVATALEGICALIEHETHGLLAPRRDIDELSKHTLMLLADEGKRRQIATRAKSRVATEFSVDRSSAQVSEVYARLLPHFRDGAWIPHGCKLRCGSADPCGPQLAGGHGGRLSASCRSSSSRAALVVGPSTRLADGGAPR